MLEGVIEGFRWRIPPVSSETLQIAVSTGNREAARHGYMPVLHGRNAPAFRLSDPESGKDVVYSFTDHPMNRFGLAVSNLCPFDDERRLGLIARAFLLNDTLHDRRFSEFVREIPDCPQQIEVDESLIGVIASIAFPTSDFPKLQDVLREVRRRRGVQAAGQGELALGDGRDG